MRNSRLATSCSFSIKYFPSCGLFFCFYVIVFVSHSAAQSCSDGWTKYQDRCYLVDVSGGRTFEYAKETCKNLHMGAVLASIPDRETAQFISDHIKHLWSTIGYCQGLYHNGTAPCAGCYPGDVRFRQGWRWLDGSVYDASETKWATREPTANTNPVRIGVFDSTLELQIGDTLKDIQIGFICSKPSGSTTHSSSSRPSVPVSSTTRATPSTAARGLAMSSNPDPQIMSTLSATAHTTNYTTVLGASDGNSKVALGLIIGVAVGVSGGVLLVLIIIIIIVLRRRRRNSGTDKKIIPELTPPSTIDDHKSQYSDTAGYGNCDPYATSTNTYRSVHPSLFNDNSQDAELIEPYSLHCSTGPTRSVDPDTIDEIEPYGVSTGLQGRSASYGASAGKFDDMENDYTNADQVQPKKAKSGGIYGMINRAQQRFTSSPIYAVPDKTKKTSKDKPKPIIKAKPRSVSIATIVPPRSKNNNN